MAMRFVCFIPLLAIQCSGYEITGRIQPPATVTVFLHGATSPYQKSVESDSNGAFRFQKLTSGTYTLAVTTASRGEVTQTIELSPGTADPRGRVDIVVAMEQGYLDADPVRRQGPVISVVTLSIPDRALREYREAQLCLSKRDATLAAEHLRRAVTIAPSFVAAWNYLGTLEYHEHHYEEAESDFRKALAVDPDAFEPLVNLGGVLLNLERPQEALHFNQIAVTRRPNNALANSQLGLAHFALRDFDAAEEDLKTAVRLDPAHFSYPQLTLAQIYIERGNRTAAAAALRDFLQRHPDSPKASEARRQVAALN